MVRNWYKNTGEQNVGMKYKWLNERGLMADGRKGKLLLEGKHLVQNCPFQWASRAFPLEALSSKAQRTMRILHRHDSLLLKPGRRQQTEGRAAQGRGLPRPASQNGPETPETVCAPSPGLAVHPQQNRHPTTPHSSKRRRQREVRGRGGASEPRISAAQQHLPPDGELWEIETL